MAAFKCSFCEKGPALDGAYREIPNMCVECFARYEYELELCRERTKEGR